MEKACCKLLIKGQGMRNSNTKLFQVLKIGGMSLSYRRQSFGMQVRVCVIQILNYSQVLKIGDIYVLELQTSLRTKMFILKFFYTVLSFRLNSGRLN